MRARLKLIQSPPAPRSGAFVGDDAALVQAFLRGDPEARDALYERHADHVHRVLYRILGFDRDLADLHHDVFVRAIPDPDALYLFLGSAALEGYLQSFRITSVARRSQPPRRSCARRYSKVVKSGGQTA